MGVLDCFWAVFTLNKGKIVTFLAKCLYELIFFCTFAL